MQLKPLQDRVVLKSVESEKTTASGIVIPDTAKEKPVMAEVISVGPGIKTLDNEVVMEVKPGDRVIYSQYAGSKVKLENQEYIIVSQKDILAIVEG